MTLYEQRELAGRYYIRLGLFSLLLACRYLLDHTAIAPVTTAAMVTLGLAVFLADGRFPRRGSGIVGVLLFLLITGTMVAVLYHGASLSPFRGWLRYGSYLAAFYVAYRWKLRFHDLGAVFLALIAVEFVVTLSQFPVNARPKGTLINSNHLSYLLVLAFGYTLIALRSPFLAALAYFYALFLNGLGGIVSIFIVAFLGLLFFPVLRRHRIVIALVVILTIVFGPEVLKDRIQEQQRITELQAHLESDTARGGGSLVWRVVTWRDGISDIVESGAWVFGKGLDYASKASSYFPEFFKEEPHNDYVRLFMELGLLGLFVYLSLYWRWVFGLFSRLKRFQDREAGMFCFVLVALAAGQIVGNILTQSTLWWVFFALFGAYRSERRTS